MADELTTGLPAGGAGDLGTGSSDPAPITFTEDARFIPPGGKDPVTWKDYSSGFVSKSDLTRMRQQDAATLKTEREAIQREQAQLKAASQQLAARLGPQQGPSPDPLAQLAEAPYVDGKSVASIVRAFQQELAKRDQAMSLMQQQFQTVQTGYQSIQGRNQQAELQTLFGEAQKAANLPDNPAVRELIESEYHAHEGWQSISADERISELSRIAKARVEGLTAAIRQQDKARVDEARTKARAPVVPSKLNGRQQVRGGGSPEEIASQLYPLMQSPDS